MSTIEIKHIEKKYPNGYQALNDINISIQEGEFVVLVGPSGCGKSTLLRMIAGLEEITSGDLLFDDTRMNEVHPKDRDIAMVFQNYALYPHMNVYDNMAFGLKLKKMPKDEINQRVREAAEKLGLTDYLDRLPKDMSGGQRQRVAIGRAIVRQPKVFLFDEPLSNLDAKLRVQMRTEIKRLHKELKNTMIYVTHDQIEAMTMADKIVIMKDGVIQQIDTPMNLFNNPCNKFVAGFIGSPSMNFVEGSIVQNGVLSFKSKNIGFVFSIPDHLKEKLIPHIDKPVTYGFRPEFIYDWDHNKHTERVLSDPLNVVVDVVEPVGSESYIYFKFKKGSLVFCMRSTSAIQYEPGQEFRIGVDINRLRFFDAETDQRLA